MDENAWGWGEKQASQAITLLKKTHDDTEITRFYRQSLCYPPNSCVEGLTLNVMIFGDGAFRW